MGDILRQRLLNPDVRVPLPVRWDLAWEGTRLPPDPNELVVGLRLITWHFARGSEAACIGVTDDPDAWWAEQTEAWTQMAVLVEIDRTRNALWLERRLLQTIRRAEAQHPVEQRRFVHQGLGLGHLDGDGPWFLFCCRR